MGLRATLLNHIPACRSEFGKSQDIVLKVLPSPIFAQTLALQLVAVTHMLHYAAICYFYRLQMPGTFFEKSWTLLGNSFHPQFLARALPLQSVAITRKKICGPKFLWTKIFLRTKIFSWTFCTKFDPQNQNYQPKPTIPNHPM